jgi:tetratricopeptide (TPR) repeat protein
MRARTLFFLLAFSSPLVARAQDDSGEAKKQFVAGSKAFSAGKFSEAATAFEAAAAIKPNAVALYTAALAWEQASQSERAADDYGRAIDLPAGGLNPQQETTAKDRLVALEKVLGTLVVSGDAGTKVQLDGFSESPVPVRLHGLGGTHSLAVKAPNKTPEKREVSLDGGQIQKLDLAQPVAVKANPNPQPQPEPEKPVVVEKPVSHVSPLKAVGWASVGIGGTSALVAILLGLSAENAGDAYKAAPSHAGYVEANALADWTTVAWITAGVFVAAGVTLVLIPEGKSAPPHDASPPPNTNKTDSDAARLELAPTVGGLILRGSF